MRSKKLVWFIWGLVFVFGITFAQSKRSVLDYINVISKESNRWEVGFYVTNTGRPTVLDLKNDYARYDGRSGPWNFTEIAVWRLKSGGDVVGVNYQEQERRISPCGDAPCSPSTQFFYIKNGEIVMLFEQQERFYDFDTRVKNFAFLQALKFVDQSDPDLDITTILDAPWNLRYSFPRVGTTITAYLSDEILRRGVKQTPVFYIKWRNGSFYASMTK